MSKEVTFFIGGTPRPQPRPRKVRGRWVANANKKSKLWRYAVEKGAGVVIDTLLWKLPLFSGAVSVDLKFTFRPPDSALDRIGKAHTHKPDKDNLEKLVLDVLEAKQFFANDSAVAIGQTSKYWGGRPGVAVMIKQLDERQKLEGPDSLFNEKPGWLS
jgi:Holliday junction resolvase RusA-like endonuclease